METSWRFIVITGCKLSQPQLQTISSFGRVVCSVIEVECTIVKFAQAVALKIDATLSRPETSLACSLYHHGIAEQSRSKAHQSRKKLHCMCT